MKKKLKRFSVDLVEAGCDEAGRGCLAGPVVAAAVILPKKFKHAYINDSKKLSPLQRNELRKIIEKEADAWAVGFFSNEEIDKVNILQASILAMHKALSELKTAPQVILVDGNYFKPFQAIPYHCMIKGDSKYLSIAAASILAKTHRDEYMEKLHEDYPAYNWKRNKGYPTIEHREAIKENGPTQFHRRSFKLLPDQLTIPFI